MKVKEESENVGLNLNTQKTKIMSSSPITSWQIDEETVSDFIFGGLQNHCSHEIKRCLLLDWKVMTSLDSILKTLDITLLTKVSVVKAMVFPSSQTGTCHCCVKWVETYRTEALAWRIKY